VEVEDDLKKHMSAIVLAAAVLPMVDLAAYSYLPFVHSWLDAMSGPMNEVSARLLLGIAPLPVLYLLVLVWARFLKDKGTSARSHQLLGVLAFVCVCLDLYLLPKLPEDEQTGLVAISALIGTWAVAQFFEGKSKAPPPATPAPAAPPSHPTVRLTPKKAVKVAPVAAKSKKRPQKRTRK
jgi:hypothetical protein